MSRSVIITRLPTIPSASYHACVTTKTVCLIHLQKKDVLVSTRYYYLIITKIQGVVDIAQWMVRNAWLRVSMWQESKIMTLLHVCDHIVMSIRSVTKFSIIWLSILLAQTASMASNSDKACPANSTLTWKSFYVEQNQWFVLSWMVMEDKLRPEVYQYKIALLDRQIRGGLASSHSCKSQSCNHLDHERRADPPWCLPLLLLQSHTSFPSPPTFFSLIPCLSTALKIDDMQMLYTLFFPYGSFNCSLKTSKIPVKSDKFFYI